MKWKIVWNMMGGRDVMTRCWGEGVVEQARMKMEPRAREEITRDDSLYPFRENLTL